MQPEVTIVVTSASLPVSSSSISVPDSDSDYGKANDQDSHPTPPAGSES